MTQKQNTAKEVAMDRKLMRLDPISAAAVSISAGTATTLFGNDTAPTASVILTLKPGQTLSPLQVKGVINLVAHAVTGLTPDNVTLTDQSGMPLGQADDTGDPGLPGGEDAKASEAARKGIQDLLDRTVGLHKAIVTVHAELNPGPDFHRLDPAYPPGGYENWPAGKCPHQRRRLLRRRGRRSPSRRDRWCCQQPECPQLHHRRQRAAAARKYANTDTTTNYDNDVIRTKTTVAPGSIKKETVTALVDTSVPADTVAQAERQHCDRHRCHTGRHDTLCHCPAVRRSIPAPRNWNRRRCSRWASQQLYSNIARALAVAVVAIVLLVLLTRSGRRSLQPQLALAGGGANVGHLAEADDEEMAALLDRGGARTVNQVIEDRPLTVEDILSEMPEAESRPRRHRPRVQSIEEQQEHENGEHPHNGGGTSRKCRAPAQRLDGRRRQDFRLARSPHSSHPALKKAPQSWHSAHSR